MKVLRKVRGKRVERSYLHILDEGKFDPRFYETIGLCGIWINSDNWEIEECDDDCNDPDFICSKCLAKREKIRNPPPPSPPKKPRLSKEQIEKNRKEKIQKAAEQRLREWNELCQGKIKQEKD